MFNIKKLCFTFLAFIFTISLGVQNATAGKVTINLGHGGGEKSAYQPISYKIC